MGLTFRERFSFRPQWVEHLVDLAADVHGL
jgi:hypothetical protein